MKLKTFFQTTAVALVCTIAPIQKASAHAISIGFENAGAGAITTWLGTYAHGGGNNLQGSMTLEGVLGTVFPALTVAFNQLVTTKPSGLIDGTTNFYAPNTTGALVGSETSFNTVCPLCGPVNHWQGVSFAGLSVGDYKFTYVPIANPTAEWTPWNPNLNGTFRLGSGVINPGNNIPEPTSLALLALGLLGMSKLRSKKNTTAC